MSRDKRTHLDMLEICCEICGIRKKAEQLRKITPLILSKIQNLNGYSDYNLDDERYPKKICNAHMNAVYEKLKFPSKDKIGFSITRCSSPFQRYYFTTFKYPCNTNRL